MPSRRRKPATTRRTTTARPRRRLPVSRRRAWSRLRQRGLRLLLLAALAAGVAYGWRLLGAGWQLSALATWDTIERKLDAQGFVARNETVVPAPADGAVRFLVAAGERVRPGQAIVELVDLADRRDLERQLDEVEKALLADQARNQETREQLAGALSRAEVAFQAAMAGLGQAALAGNAGTMAETWPAAVAAARARFTAGHRLEDVAAARDGLLARREGLLESMKDTGRTVLAAGQGLVGLEIDGLEGVTPETVAGLTAWGVLALRPEPSGAAAGRRVETGEALCKLVGPEGLAVALVVPSGAGARLETGQRVTVRFPGTGDGVLRATVTMVGAPERSGYRLVTLETEGVLPGLVSARWVQCEVLEVSRSGVVVPRAALTSREGQDGVLVLSRTSAYFRPVTVLVSMGGRALVDGISPGTVVATYPWLWNVLGKVRAAPG